MIAILTYGSGNVKAISNIYTQLNIPFIHAQEPADLRHATGFILPGVGAFDTTMSQLLSSGMKDALDDYVLDKKIPVLGICVGMQILAESSEEGNQPGLGWIKGRVRKFDEVFFHQQTYLPHMGWNGIQHAGDHPLLHEVTTDTEYYFLHSYYFHCDDASDSVATTTYGHSFSSLVGREHIFGVQFHPEKSHKAGVQLLKNFGRYVSC